MSKKREQLVKLVDEVLDSREVDLYWLNWGKLGEDWVLEVTIDKQGQVTSGDCATISREISTELDKEDLINRSYELRVSSPGTERPLMEPRHYKLAIGKAIQVKTYAKVNGRKKLEGELLSYDEEKDEIKLAQEERVLTVCGKNIAKAWTKDDNEGGL